MKLNNDLWTPFSTNNETRLTRRYSFDSEASRAEFVQLTGLYMSSPRTSVLLENLADSKDIAAHIKTSNDPFMIEFADIISREFDEIYERFNDAMVAASA